MAKRNNRLGAAALIALLAGLGVSGRAWAASPIEQIRITVEQVVKVLKDSRLQGEKAKGVSAELRRVISPRFDFVEMAKRSLGHHWQRYQERQEEFVPAFIALVERFYLEQLKSFKDERILYLRERVENGFAEVDTKILREGRTEVPIGYRLRRVDGEWKVYDMLIENVSLVNNYRAQFNRILVDGSFEDLLKKLSEKAVGEKEKQDRMARLMAAGFGEILAAVEKNKAL